MKPKFGELFHQLLRYEGKLPPAPPPPQPTPEPPSPALLEASRKLGSALVAAMRKKRKKPRRISKEAANEEAIRLCRRDPEFAKKTGEEWAEAIGCSPRLVDSLPAWKALHTRPNEASSQEADLERLIHEQAMDGKRRSIHPLISPRLTRNTPED